MTSPRLSDARQNAHLERTTGRRETWDVFDKGCGVTIPIRPLSKPLVLKEEAKY
jgi:hypothetical protein